jgi:hypothetical protein
VRGLEWHPFEGLFDGFSGLDAKGCLGIRVALAPTPQLWDVDGGNFGAGALGDPGAELDGCQVALDRVTRAQMMPVLGREIVERSERLPVLLEAWRWPLGTWRRTRPGSAQAPCGHPLPDSSALLLRPLWCGEGCQQVFAVADPEVGWRPIVITYQRRIAGTSSDEPCPRQIGDAMRIRPR